MTPTYLILALLSFTQVSNHAILVPEPIKKNWFSTENGEWVLGMQQQKIAYDGDFWELTELRSEGVKYIIQLQKTDTICYYNTSGRYVCEWKDRSETLALSPGKGQQLLIQNEHANIQATVNPKANYKPTEKLADSFEPGMAIFKGYVINATPQTKDQGITLYVDDLFYADQRSYSTGLEEDGFFYLQVPLTTAQDIYIRPGKSIFLEPGKTTIALINASKKADIYFMGAHASLNRDLTQFNSDPGNNFDFRADRKNMKFEPETYRESRKQLQETYLADFKKYSRKHQTSPAFQHWFSVNAQLRYYKDLMRYRWLRTKFSDGMKRMSKHPTYFSFIKEIDYTDPAYRISGNLSDLVRELHNYYFGLADHRFSYLVSDPRFVRKLLNSEATLEESDRHTLEQYLGYFPVVDKPTAELSQEQAAQIKQNEALFKELQKQHYQFFMENLLQAQKQWKTQHLEKVLDHEPRDTFIKQYTLIHALNQQLGQGRKTGIDFYWPLVQDLALEPGVLDHLQYRYDEVQATFDRPLPKWAEIKNTSVGSAQALLKEIAQKHSGKMVYIDIWATWCAPCHQELKKNGPLKKAFAKAEVAAVYLCASGEEKLMENAIKKYELAGDHYFLSERISREVRAQFDIGGYPSYLIMNKHGQVVNTKAPPPSQLEALMAEIDRLK